MIKLMFSALGQSEGLFKTTVLYHETRPLSRRSCNAQTHPPFSIRQAMDMAAGGQIRSAKTIIALQYLALLKAGNL